MNFQLPDELIFLKNKNLPQKKSTTPMDQQVCIVTGSTSGVGLETIKQLVMGKAHVVMIARNLQKAEAIKDELVKQYNASIDIIIADFSDLEDVRKAAHIILENYPQIDVLINSVGMYSTKQTFTKYGIETVFCVNHLAPFLFTYLLLDRMKENKQARIIQVNSEGHRFSKVLYDDVNLYRHFYYGLRSYGASKTAQLLTVWEFSDLLKDTNVTINAVHPGEVRTNIGNNNGWLYRFFLHHITWHFLKDPKISGESIYYLASSPDLLGVSGKFFHLTNEEKPAKHALDRKLSKKIFDLSIQLTSLNKEVKQ